MGKDRSDLLAPSIRGEVLGHILTYISTGVVHVSERNVEELLMAADYLLLNDLIKYIENVYIRQSMSISNCLTFYLAALRTNRDAILCESFRFILTHFEVVVELDDSEFGEIPLKSLKQLLGSKNLRVSSEHTVWMAIAKWVQTDVARRQHLVPHLLTCVALSDVDKQLAKTILEHEIVASNPFCVEIRQLKKLRLFHCHPDILVHHYIKFHPKPVLDSFHSRRPEQFYFVTHNCAEVGFNSNMYVTYDDDVDIWRKIAEINMCPNFMVSVGRSIYMFEWSAEKILRFNLIEKTFSAMRHPCVLRDHYAVVQVDGSIYIIGGTAETDEDSAAIDVGDVDVYDPEADAWYNASAMMSVAEITAATLGKTIYVFGLSPKDEMVVQIYDCKSDEWSVLSSPPALRFAFEVVTHRGRVYILGGKNQDSCLDSVDVFNPEAGQWEMHKKLPHTFCKPKAIVLNNDVIVYESEWRKKSDHSNRNSAVLFDKKIGEWKTSEKLSFVNSFYKYNFFPQIVTGHTVDNMISADNKDPVTNFMKSPFS